MEQRKRINEQIMHELPGLLYYLMHDYCPPPCCVSSSFGCKEFIHPTIEEQIETATPEATLKELIIDHLRARSITATPVNGCDFVGSSSELFSGIMTSVHKDGLYQLAKSTVSFGMRLSDLCKIYPHHFRVSAERVNNNKQYHISINGFIPIQQKLGLNK